MKKWKIPVTWEMCGIVTVEADSLEEAIDIARDDDGVIPLPQNDSYVEGSWRLSTEDEELIRSCYNSHSRNKTEKEDA